MSQIRTFVLTAVVMGTAVAQANSEVQRLLDSYVIAKAETQQPPLNDEEVQKTPYTIQVASYINEKDAASHVEELKLQEKDVLYYPAFVRGQIWFKVCVGKFPSKEQAEEYRKKFVKRMDEPFAVVISMLDRPKASEDQRMPASVAAKESTPVPVASADKTKEGAAPKMDVVLKPATPVKKEVAAAKVTEAVSEKVTEKVTVPPGGKGLVAEESVKAQVPAASADGVYTLQVGAFPSEELAKTKLNSLPVKDQDAFVQSAEVKGQTWYRVYVGKFKDKREAENFQKLFSEQTKGGESLIRRLKQ